MLLQVQNREHVLDLLKTEKKLNSMRLPLLGYDKPSSLDYHHELFVDLLFKIFEDQIVKITELHRRP